MDKATYETIQVLAGSGAEKVEYWNEDAQKWVSERPSQASIRIPGLVHEASTLFMDEDATVGTVDENYLVHGTKNVVSFQSYDEKHSQLR
jgi:hypothetical protein